jgi:LuxR family quorum sensing-dependent transcriptional regulator
MLLTKTGVELVEHLERQQDVPSLIASFQRVVESFGMDVFCIGDPTQPEVKRRGRRWDGTWSAEWSRHYASLNLFSVDRSVARMNIDPRPFRWSDEYVGVTEKQKPWLDEIFIFGMQDGLVVPIHGPHGAVAGISIGAAQYELSRQDERALHLASLYLHAKMSALRAERSPRPMRSLTPRECECLKWVAAGKTDWEISQILNISEQTAHGYVQNALTKLNARTRAQAVALAMQTAQILP